MLWIVLGGVLFLICWGAWIGAKHRAEAIRKAHANYENALNYLSLHPADPQARVACLETGRIHYNFKIPDTETVNGRGVVVQTINNSANREARIQSDIEARVGHLKVAA